MKEEGEHHTRTESANRNGKANKKEDYDRTDNANISEIETDTK